MARAWLLEGSDERNYGTPHEWALGEYTWSYFFARWGMALSGSPREASVVVAMVYTYEEIARRLHNNEAFRPYFHNLLRVMEFAYEAAFIEPTGSGGKQWRVLGLGVPSAEEATVVLARSYMKKIGWGVWDWRYDVAVVNVYSGSFAREGERDDVAHVQRWIEEAMKCLKSKEYHERLPRRDRGVDIAAVVFTRGLNENGGNNVRALADTLREKFPQHIPPGFHDDPDRFSDAIFLIWWEERNGERELWYSAINLGPSPITRELELAVVRGLAIGDHPGKTVIRRYDADTRTSSVVSGWDEPMVEIHAGRWLPTSEVYIPCAAWASGR